MVKGSGNRDGNWNEEEVLVASSGAFFGLGNGYKANKLWILALRMRA